MKQQRSCLCVMALAGLVAMLALSAPAAWFGGGGYDGYDRVRGSGAPDYPQVNNAAGATNVTPTNAWLNGMLICTGSAPASVWVHWGKTNGGTSRAAWSNSYEFGAVAEFAPLSRQVTLDPNSTYYYRFYATNTAGEEGWAPESAVFLTPGSPTVSTAPGAGAGITQADLNGRLTGGSQAWMWLDWGQTAAAGVAPAAWTTNDLGLRTEAGTIPAPNPFVVRVTGLSSSAYYAYRVRASNDWGVVASDWVWFVTRPADFITVPGAVGWSGGGAYDGYDILPFSGVMQSGGGGTVITIR